MVTEETITAPNSSSNDAPFMVEQNYSSRSIPLASVNLFIDSGKRDCVATAHVRRNALSITFQKGDLP